MPSFTIDFEVYCADCGEGLCNQSETRKSRQRQEDQVTVAACQKCVEAAFERGSDSRDSELADLMDQIKDLQQELQSWKDEV